MTAIDDLAVELHDGVHVQMQRYVDGPGWPNEVERLVYQSLDAALALFLAYLDQLDERDPEQLH